MMYGSSRLGSVILHEKIDSTTVPDSVAFELARGQKRYELNNHLGNVLTTVSDRKKWECDSNYYHADIINVMDYSPFGAPLAGRITNPCFQEVWTIYLDSMENYFRITLADTASNEYNFQVNSSSGAPFEAALDSIITLFNSMPGLQGSRNGYHLTFKINTCEFPLGIGVDLDWNYSTTTNRDTVYVGGYTFGFNGELKENELYGEENAYDYGYRMYDPRIGRFMSVDPLAIGYPYMSPYIFAGNQPIWAKDLDGLEQYYVTEIDNGDGTGTIIVLVNIDEKTGEIVWGQDKEHKVQYTKIVHGGSVSTTTVTMESDFTGTHGKKEKELGEGVYERQKDRKGIAYAAARQAWKTVEKMSPNYINKETRPIEHYMNDYDDIEMSKKNAVDFSRYRVDEAKRNGGTIKSISMLSKKDDTRAKEIQTELKKQYGVPVKLKFDKNLSSDFTYQVNYQKQEGSKKTETIIYENIKPTK